MTQTSCFYEFYSRQKDNKILLSSQIRPILITLRSKAHILTQKWSKSHEISIFSIICRMFRESDCRSRTIGKFSGIHSREYILGV